MVQGDALGLRPFKIQYPFQSILNLVHSERGILGQLLPVWHIVWILGEIEVAS